MTTINLLDVTTLEPRQKHPTIFARYDVLKEGESLTIHNDHDPKPLYYQLLGERGNAFTWEYLEEGPEWWKVRITKRISGQGDDTLGELAAKDLRKAQIFRQFGLDFSCGGKMTVKEACSEKGLDVTRIEKELQQVDRQPAQISLPYTSWPLPFFADYISFTYHAEIKKCLADSSAYSKKVAEVHGEQHPELFSIDKVLTAFRNDFLNHIASEESDLFPKIKSNAGGIGTKDCIKRLEIEHLNLHIQMKQIRSLSKDFTLPEDACASYELLFNTLKAFEDRLADYIHLENNIFFPRVSDGLN